MKTSTRHLITFGIVAIFAIFAAGTSNNDSGSSGSSAGPAPEAAKKTYTYVDEDCASLAKNFGTQSELSDLQKEEAWKAYEGKAFRWNLEVTEVSSDAFGGFTVQYRCAQNSPSLIQDVVVKYQDSHKDHVMGLNKGKSYEVTGVLTRSSSLLGMSADAIVE